MFGTIDRDTGYFAYAKQFDRECGIGELSSRENIDTLNRYWSVRGFSESGAEMQEAISSFADVSVDQDTTVTFLVEMAGSMQGRRIAEASKAVLAAAIELERNGARVEILGFTTAQAQNGYKAWQKDKIVQFPGRVSDLLHVVVKERSNLAEKSPGHVLAMAGHGLNRDNVDGEAIRWAAQRLHGQIGQNKVLVVVSDDWRPQCDLSRRLNSGDDFLERHMRAVVKEVEESPISLLPVIIAPQYAVAEQDTYSEIFRADDSAASILNSIREAVTSIPSLKAATHHDSRITPGL